MSACPRMVVACLLAALLALSASALAAEKTIPPKVFAAATWNLPGGSETVELWAPYLPLVHTLVRYKIGFRISPGMVKVRCPLKLTVRYDDTKARAGDTLRLKVKLEPAAASGSERTFDSQFGVSLPAKVQVGAVGVAGLADNLLPWFDLPVDFWGLVGLMGPYGAIVQQAATNTGVSMTSQAALPLGQTASRFSDERTLITAPLSKIFGPTTGGAAGDKVRAIWNKIPSGKRDAVLTAIAVADQIDTSAAESKILNLMSQGVALIANAGDLSLVADPYWKVKGKELNLALYYGVPQRSYNNTTVMTFTRLGEEKTLDVPVPIFCATGEKLQIAPLNADYRFQLFQGAKAKIKFSGVIKKTLEQGERLVTLATAHVDYPSSPVNTMEIPLAGATNIINELRVTRTTHNTAQVSYFSPSLALKGTITVSKLSQGGATVVKAVSETSFESSHYIDVSGLEPNTNYRFSLTAKDSQNNTYDGGHVDARTQAAPPKEDNYSANASASTVDGSVQARMWDWQVIPGVNNITFRWKTNVPASTEVHRCDTSDYSVTTLAAKHQNGQVTVGAVDAIASPRELVTSHELVYPNLNPSTTYYYLIRSYVYSQRNDPQSPILLVLGKKGSTKTLAPPPSASLRIRLNTGGKPMVGSASVVFTRESPAPHQTLTLPVDQNLRTAEVTVQPGGRYTLGLASHPCFTATTRVYNCPAGAQGSQPEQILALDPFLGGAGGVIKKADGTGIAGAKVRRQGSGSWTTVGASGVYTTVSGLPTNPTGLIPLEAQADGYFPGTGNGQLDACGRFTAAPITLVTRQFTLNLNARIKNGGPPVSGAKVKLVEPGASSPRQLGVTNTSGNFSGVVSLPGNQPASYNLLIEAPQGTGISAAMATIHPTMGGSVSVNVELEQRIALSCQQFSLASGGSGGSVRATFQANLPVKAMLEGKPSGGAVRTLLPYGQSFTRSATYTLPFQSAGAWQIRAKLRDEAGREVVSDWRDWIFWVTGNWHLAAGNLSTSGATLTWSAFPDGAQFHHYELKLGVAGQPLNRTETVIGRTTTQLALTGLSTCQRMRAQITARNSSGAQLGESALVDFTLPTPPPTITNFRASLTTVAVGQSTRLQAEVRCPTGCSSNLSAVSIHAAAAPNQALYQVPAGGMTNTGCNLDTTLSFSAPGPHNLVLKARDNGGREATQNLAITVSPGQPPALSLTAQSTKVKAGQEASILAKITNHTALTGQLSLLATWATGQTQEVAVAPGAAAVGTSLKHVYASPGSYNPRFRAKLVKAGGIELLSDEKTMSVLVEDAPPQLTLTASGAKNRKTLRAKIVAGSLTLDSWELDFGDKTAKQTGQGALDREFEHYYPQRTAVSDQAQAGNKELGNYAAALSVVDGKKQRHQISLQVKVPPNSTDSPQGDGSGQLSGGGACDLSLASVRAPKSATAGQPVQLTATLRSNLSLPLDNCVLRLSQDGTELARVTCRVNSGRKGSQVALSFTLQKAEAARLKLELLPPTGWRESKASDNQKDFTLEVKAGTAGGQGDDTRGKGGSGDKDEDSDKSQKKAEIGLTVSAQAPDKTLKPGSVLRLSVKLENRSSAAVKDAVFTATLDGRDLQQKKLALKPGKPRTIALRIPLGKQAGVKKLRLELAPPSGHGKADGKSGVMDMELRVGEAGDKKQSGDTDDKDKKTSKDADDNKTSASSGDLHLRAQLKHRRFPVGQAQSLTARLRNDGAADLSGCVLRVSLEGKVLAESKVDLPAHRWVSQSLSFKLDQAGKHSLSVELISPPGFQDKRPKDNQALIKVEALAAGKGNRKTGKDQPDKTQQDDMRSQDGGKTLADGLKLEGLKLPKRITQGKAVKVQASIAVSPGVTAKQCQAVLYLDGKEVASQKCRLQPGRKSTVNLTFIPDSAGKKELKVILAPLGGGSQGIPDHLAKAMKINVGAAPKQKD